MRKFLWFISIVLLFAAIGAPASHAGSITYKVSDTATGIIGGTSFADAPMTITFVGNTSNVISYIPGILVNQVGTGTVTIGGIGTFLFTDAMESFVNQNTSGAGISDVTIGAKDILDTLNSAFGTYGLTTAVGPLTGPSRAYINASFTTNNGVLILSGVGPDSTFTATTSTSATPEPSSLLLFGTSLLGLAPFRRKLFGR
jgi:PEP-CTERM motif